MNFPGGMRQRGNIVRALSLSLRILIMDEPFGPLDAQTRLLLQNLRLDLWADERKTIIFITHDLHEAIALGDRVVVLTARPGRIKSIHPSIFRGEETSGICRERDLQRPVYEHRRRTGRRNQVQAEGTDDDRDRGFGHQIGA